MERGYFDKLSTSDADCYDRRGLKKRRGRSKRPRRNRFYDCDGAISYHPATFQVKYFNTNYLSLHLKLPYKDPIISYNRYDINT